MEEVLTTTRIRKEPQRQKRVRSILVESLASNMGIIIIVLLMTPLSRQPAMEETRMVTMDPLSLLEIRQPG